jgi:CheY-like chemotaxis protein
MVFPSIVSYYDPAKRSSQAGNCMKILIVDDNADTRRLIRALVDGNSRQIIEAKDGREAVVSFRLHRPDWVFMDIEMKGMDGLAALRMIRNDEPGARIVIVTMHDNQRLRAEAHEAGAVGYVLKDNLTELSSILTGA